MTYIRYSVIDRRRVIADVYVLDSQHIVDVPKRTKRSVWTVRRGRVGA